jgi:glutaredoxin
VPSTTVTLIGKPGCHLCDVARVALTEVLVNFDGVVVVERSILDEPDLHNRYWDQIPVVLIDDAVHAIYRVDAALLQAELVARGH